MDNIQLGNIPHPAEETLERYVMKTCRPAEAETLEEHLLFCDPCRGRLEQAEEWVSLMKVALPMGPKRPRVVPGQGPISRIFAASPRTMALAACAVVLVCTPLLLYRAKSVPAQVVELAANRGGGTAEALTTANANARLTLHISATDLSGPVEVAVVDAAGDPVFTQKVPSLDDRILLPGKLKAGRYWVRLNRIDDHQPLREFGLQVR